MYTYANQVARTRERRDPLGGKKNKINKVKRSAILPQHDSTTQEAAAWEFSKINKNPPKFK